MSFGRSASGPGGLSINTNSANSLFGSAKSSQVPQSGGLFGSTTQNSQPSGGLFGASTNTSQPQQIGGLFGGSQPNQQPQQQQGGGLFGSQTNNSQPQQAGGSFGGQANAQQGGGMFGSSNAQQSQPQQSGGLFGGSLGLTENQNQNQNQNQGQNQSQQQSGGLFGGSSTQTKPSLFGNTAVQPSQNQQTQPQRPTLFGNLSSSTNMNTQQPQRPSLFGSISTTSAPQQSSLFGTGMSGGLAGGLSLGQSTQQQQQSTVPGVRIDVANVRGTTHFGDLHEELQRQIETIDNFVLQQIHYKEQCDALMPSLEDQSSYIPNDVDFVSRRLDTVQRGLENDAEAIDHVRGLVKKDAADAKLSFRAIDNLKLPQQYHHTGLWNVPSSASRLRGPQIPAEEGETEEGSADLVSYFSAQADEMAKTLDNYRKNVHEIESHLRGVEASTVQQMQQLMFMRGKDGGERSAEDQVRELAAVLREFENGILGVAGKVGGAREGVQELALGNAQSNNGKSGRRHGVY
ncbi:MAG: hypothetical protein M1827_002466 [Pycnora praestabilis]|nr:MAG: hypothetical protein M1827_002466 [Pycnora praestabilis]